MFILVYVDDILITSSSSKLVQSLIFKLDAPLCSNNLGTLNYILGIEVTFKVMLFISIKNIYIQELLDRCGLVDTKSCDILMTIGKSLSQVDDIIILNDNASL